MNIIDKQRLLESFIDYYYLSIHYYYCYYYYYYYKLQFDGKYTSDDTYIGNGSQFILI